ncbi:MAG: hypothetical protein ACI4NO_01455 [Oxalobacter sp.]
MFSKLQSFQVVINEGEVAETGTHEELIEHEAGVYRALYNAQFQKM